MQKQVILKSNKINYTIKKSKRSKRIRLSVGLNGSVVVTMPYGLSDIVAERFVLEKIEWLSSKIDFFKQFKGRIYTDKDYILNKEKAYSLVDKKVKYFSSLHDYKYNKISIKNQKTRWGSCSRKGNLNFNYKIIFLSEDIQDYIVVHELCHLKELNHSKKFWNLVENIVPGYKESRKKLRNSSLVIK